MWRRAVAPNGDGIWRDTRCETLADRLELPDIGDIGALGDLYRHTPLEVRVG